MKFIIQLVCGLLCLSCFAQDCITIKNKNYTIASMQTEGVWLMDSLNKPHFFKGVKIEEAFLKPQSCYQLDSLPNPEELRIYSDSKQAWVHLLQYGFGQTEVDGKGENYFIQNMIREALRHIGQESKIGETALRDDVLYWCTAPVFWAETFVGNEIPKNVTLAARSWLNYGQRIHNFKNIKIGDIAVLWRVCKEDCWQGHVGYIVGFEYDTNFEEGGSIYILGGNQTNQVNITKFDISELLGVVRSIKE